MSAQLSPGVMDLEENSVLKEQVRKLERENRSLRRSVLDLNLRISSIRREQGKTLGKNSMLSKHFDVDRALERNEDDAFDESSGSRQSVRERKFAMQAKLVGHTAAIYCCSYSPSGALIATGSLDKTVRLWNAETHDETAVLEGHTVAVSDLAWSKDNQSLFTGSFDKTVRLWQVGSGKQIYTKSLEGLVQSVATSSDPNLFFASTSRKKLYLIDVRAADQCAVLEHDSIVNSIYASANSFSLVTGDANGAIYKWDMRSFATGRQQKSPLADVENAAPISHVAVSTGRSAHDEGRFLAANAYDNTVRLYDRGTSTSKGLKLLCTATGHISKNWPIRCSVFHAQNRTTQTNVDGVDESTDEQGDDDDDDADSATQQLKSADLRDVLVACGSADNDIRVFHAASVDGIAPLSQRLKGHSGKVYAVNFHPTTPCLVSCSDDRTAMVWALSSRHE
eukprot:m.191074 g.191074  ORF g.191074 m.191074 type:complete len:451 (-) comp32421_c9_seq1:705-2057(-)